MSEPIDGGSTETTDASAPNEVDAQLAEMRTAETSETPEQVEQKPAEAAPEVKKVVPLAALHEERRERQALQRQIAEDRRLHQEQMARINQRLEQMMTPQKQLPDREQQPVEYLDHRINELTQVQQQAIQRDQLREQEAQRDQAIAMVRNAMVASEASFTKTTPDFPDAYNHLNQMRARELMVLGSSEEEALAQAVQELSDAAMRWTANGKHAAQTVYEFAKARGYTPKSVQTPEQKIAAQQKGTAAAKSLGSGGAVTGKLTAQALADMDDAEFEQVVYSDWRRAMGG
jgi:hypothetical protein